jgi:hypothetical protein
MIEAEQLRLKMERESLLEQRAQLDASQAAFAGEKANEKASIASEKTKLQQVRLLINIRNMFHRH